MQATPPSLASKSYKINAGRLNFLLAGFLFKIALDASYVTYLTEAFADHFLTPFQVKFSIFQYLESFAWLGIPLLLVPFSSKSAGGLAFFCAIVFLCAPVASIYGLDSDRSRDTLALTVLAIGVAYFVSSVGVRRSKRIKLPERGETYLLYISFLFMGMFLAVAAFNGVLFNMQFDIDRIYEYRLELGSKVDIGLFVYSNLWAQKVFTPLVFAVGLRRKSVWLIGSALTMQLIYFGVTQHRAHLFSPLLVIFAYFLYRKDFSYAKGFFYSACTLFGLSILISNFELEALGAITVRRALFVGPSVTYSWVEYFTQNPKVFFADNLLASFVDNQYTRTNLPMLMGNNIREGYDIAFNVGLVGTGFAQLGVFGVILYGAIIGVVIRINDRLIESGVPPYISASVLFFPYRIAWADSDLFTSLLSHGLLVGTFAVWLFGSPRKMLAPSNDGRRFPKRERTAGRA